MHQVSIQSERKTDSRFAVSPGRQAHGVSRLFAVWALLLAVAMFGTTAARADFINGVFKVAADPWWSGTVNYNKADATGAGNGALGGLTGNTYNHVDLSLTDTDFTKPLDILFTTTYRYLAPGTSTPFLANDLGRYNFSVFVLNNQPGLSVKNLDFAILDRATGGVGSPETNATFSTTPTPTVTGTNPLILGPRVSKLMRFAGSPGFPNGQGQTFFFTIDLTNSLTSAKPTGQFVLRITTNPEPRSLILGGMALAGAFGLWYRRRRQNRKLILKRRGVKRKRRFGGRRLFATSRYSV